MDGEGAAKRGVSQREKMEDEMILKMEVCEPWNGDFQGKPGQTSLSEHLYSLSRLQGFLGNVKIVHVLNNDLRKFVTMQALWIQVIFLSI